MSLSIWLRSVSTKVFHGRALADELREELDTHIALRTEDLERQGLSRAEAERRARIEFGAVEKFREESREALGGERLDKLLQNIRYALRQLRSTPGFASAVIVTIALAMGANLTVFSFFQAILLNKLPVHNPEELYSAAISDPGHPDHPFFSYPDVQKMAGICKPAVLAGFTNEVQYHLLDSDGTTSTLRGQLVTGNFFSTLGAHPFLGRIFSPQDNTDGAQSVAVISFGLWSRRYGRDTGIIGKRVIVQRAPVTIVGVMPRMFSGVIPGERTDIWMPLSVQPAIGFGGYASMNRVDSSKPWLDQDVSWLRLIARSPSDPGGKHLAAQLDSYIQREVNAGLANTHDAAERQHLMHVRMRIESAAGGTRGLRDRFSLPLIILLSLVALLLLSGCLNIVNLALARFRAREHEMSVRMALGSTRGRLVALLATENLILCVIGAGASVVLAWVASSLIQHWLVTAQSIQIQIGFGPGSLAFATALTLGACLLISAAPALRTRGLTTARLSGFRTSAAGSHAFRASSGLLILQLALAILTVTATSLLVRTLRNYEHVKLGVDGAHTLSVSLDPSAAGYITYGQQQALYSRLTQTIDRMPGVISSAVAGCGLMNHGCAYLNALVSGSDVKAPVVERNYVGPDYFSTTGMKILRGRAFSIDDSAHAESVAVVNRDFEKQLLRNQDAIGHTIRVDGGKPAVIVGVVNDSRTDSIKAAPAPFVFLPIAQAGAWNISHVEVRTEGNPVRMAPAVREAILGINRAIPVGETMTVEEEADRDLAREFLMARLGLVFSFLSLLIAAVGVYGLTSYEGSRRQTEFAIRMALGATRLSILRQVFTRSALLLGIGGVAGLLISAAFSRLIASLLYGVGPYDPGIYAVALLLILIASAGAAFLPSWQAASADPVHSLHRE